MKTCCKPKNLRYLFQEKSLCLEGTKQVVLIGLGRLPGRFRKVRGALSKTQPLKVCLLKYSKEEYEPKAKATDMLKMPLAKATSCDISRFSVC